MFFMLVTCMFIVLRCVQVAVLSSLLLSIAPNASLDTLSNDCSSPHHELPRILS